MFKNPTIIMYSFLQITKLQKQSAKLKERDMIEDSLKQKEKQYTVLKNKHRTALIEVLGEMPESGYAMAVNKFEVNMKSEIDAMKKKLKANDKEVILNHVMFLSLHKTCFRFRN